MSRILKQTHGVFNDHFVIETKEFDNLFYDPRFDDREVHFPHIDLQSKMRHYLKCDGGGTSATHLFVKALGEFHGFQEFEFLVGESTVLVGRRALEEP